MQALARTLDDEAVSVTNFEAALNKRSSLRVEPNRAHQRSDTRWAAPRPVTPRPRCRWCKRIAEPAVRIRSAPAERRPILAVGGGSLDPRTAAR
jgi:hypothetical protein